MEGARGGPPPQLARRRTIAAAMPVFELRTEGKLIFYFTVICLRSLLAAHPVEAPAERFPQTATLAV